MTSNDELDRMIDDALAPEDDALHAWLDHAHRAEHADGGTLDLEPAEPEWQIDGERTAEWCARRLIALEDERARAKAEADRLRAVADAYLERVLRRTEGHVAFFEGRLRQWHNRVLAENPKAKTIDLPSGKLEQRVGSVSVDVTDATALVEWLEEHAEDLVRYADPTPDKAAIKARYGAKVDPTQPGAFPAVDEATGEVLPGVAIVRGVPTERFKRVVAATTEDGTDTEEG